MRFAALRNFLNGDTPDQADEGQEGEGGAPPADGEGEEEKEEDGEGDGEEGDDGEEEEEEEDGAAAPDSNATAAERAAARKATITERKRWATVLTSKQAEGQEETAAALLVENMPAAAILRVLGNSAPANTPAARLRQMPRTNLGGAQPGAEGRDGGTAAASRKKAVANVNNRVGRGANVTSASRRVMPGKASKGAEQ